MLMPGERALREERTAFGTTIAGLSDEEFEGGPTLCAGWAPRDVAAHVLGIDNEPLEYVRAGGRLAAAHDRIVTKARSLSRAEVEKRLRRWAASPAPQARLAAAGLLGDVAVHHQDVLRGVGRSRVVPEASRAAILREGVVLGGRRLLTHRVVPTDGGRSLGRGAVVTGTREALGMWLCGRAAVEPELVFSA